MGRVIVYIDWFNVYHSMDDKFGKKYNWLNYKKLSEKFLESGDEIVNIKYFTAMYDPTIWNWKFSKKKSNKDIDRERKHKLYIQALKTQWVETILWQYQRVKKNFSSANDILEIFPPHVKDFLQRYMKSETTFKDKFNITYYTLEEKKTDVNIAVDIVSDAFLNLYDKAILITWDNDISPAISTVKENMDKEFTVVFPFWWKWKSLKKVCDKICYLAESHLQDSQFPDKFVDWTTVFQRPEDWG